jgi:hypothetical protein
VNKLRAVPASLDQLKGLPERRTACSGLRLLKLLWLRRLHVVQQSQHDRIGIHAFGLSLKVRRDAMTKDWQRNFLDIIRIDTESPIHRGKRLGSGN